MYPWGHSQKTENKAIIWIQGIKYKGLLTGYEVYRGLKGILEVGTTMLMAKGTKGKG